jgi:sirohydrochlorin cobaltochelatase
MSLGSADCDLLISPNPCSDQPMKPTIIIATFGTSPAALDAYRRIDKAVASHFHGFDIRWCYSARGKKTLSDPGYPRPPQVLAELVAAGVSRAVVQHLLLLPGREFHEMQSIFTASSIACFPGMPLLCAPQDHHTLGDLLEATIAARPDKAILLLGHGTVHPTWTTYYCLQTLLRRRFGKRVFVGAIENYPDSSALPQEIRDEGFTEVCLIPLVLVTATHFSRDMIGDHPASWTSRLAQCGLTVEVVERGLSQLPGFPQWLVGHIDAALQLIDQR